MENGGTRTERKRVDKGLACIHIQMNEDTIVATYANQIPFHRKGRCQCEATCGLTAIIPTKRPFDARNPHVRDGVFLVNYVPISASVDAMDP